MAAEETKLKVPVLFKGDEMTMEEALNKFIAAGKKLSEVWENDQAKRYPKYLPSFDEFLADFSRLLEEQDE